MAELPLTVKGRGGQGRVAGWAAGQGCRVAGREGKGTTFFAARGPLEAQAPERTPSLGTLQGFGRPRLGCVEPQMGRLGWGGGVGPSRKIGTHPDCGGRSGSRLDSSQHAEIPYVSKEFIFVCKMKINNFHLTWLRDQMKRGKHTRLLEKNKLFCVYEKGSV